MPLHFIGGECCQTNLLSIAMYKTDKNPEYLDFSGIWLYIAVWWKNLHCEILKEYELLVYIKM